MIIIAAGIGLYFVWRLFNIDSYISKSVPAATENLQKITELNTAVNDMRYYDEALTQSARNYAFTGDVKWKNRYNDFVVKLDKVIKLAQLNGGQEEKQFFDEVDKANIALVKMETDSMKKVEDGEKNIAVKILESNDYWNQKGIYKNGLDKYLLLRGSSETQTFDSLKGISFGPIQDIKNSINRDLLIFSLAIIIGIILSILLNFYVSNEIVKPIISLEKNFNDIASGKILPFEFRKSNDEIGKLASDFGFMVNKIQSRQRNVEEETSDCATDLKKFKLVADNTSDQVVITDKDGTVVYLNHAAEQSTGYEMFDSIGKKAAFLWKNPMPKEFYEKLWNTIKTQKKSFNGEIKNRRANGNEYIASVNISPVLDKNGEILFFVGLERDITGEKAIDKARSEFALVASHQLRSPLTIINWYIEIMRSKETGALNESQSRYLDQIYLGSQRMVKLVNELLNVSRLETTKLMVEPQDTNLADFIDDEVRKLTPLATEHKCELVFKKSKIKPSSIPIDRILLHQVMNNIIINSIYYSQADGGKVLINLSKNESDYIISVSDDGIGVPEIAQAHLYEKFYRADNARTQVADGSGLGLYLVKTIVETYGGKVWFESPTKSRKNKAGKVEKYGTTFNVSIPIEGMRSREGEKVLLLDKR